ncbi:hypothetical protein PV328_009011 [Microctonus aethiopoides]|uniref:Peptidase M12B domain-containing protein n=1 Tax=Microctonus aethiopoides TaxID=144406 RepID=A0AA39FKG3_9HYME|nr:hypothetical protein PV328_009011 [Microctonus aethiopoides]
MTQDELKQTFYNAESIPKYQIARLVQNKIDGDASGNSSTLSFNAFGEKKTIELKLYESTLISDRTPIWLAKYNATDKSPFFEQLKPFTLGNEVTLYQTSEGSIIGSGIDKNGKLYFAGSTSKLVISPVTSRVSREISRRKRNIPHDENDESSDEYIVTDYHIIYNVPQSSNNNMLQSAIIKTENLIDEFKRKNDSIKLGKVKRDVSTSLISPEILLFTDFKSLFTKPEGKAFNKFIIYLIAFWNNVAMHFKALKNPLVSLRITGIVIGTVHEAIPFLHHQMSPDKHIFVMNALFDMGDWLMNYKNIFPLETYDFAVAMTSRHLCEKHIMTNKCKRDTTIGMANIKAKCAINGFRVEMCSVIHDELNFKGVLTATHELAHIMGAQHDGISTTSTRHCDLNDLSPNYIMTPVVTDVPQNYVWSTCTQETLFRDWWRGAKDCLKINSTIDTGKTVSIILPGDIESLERQCITRGYSHACNPTSNTCEDLECWTDSVKGLFSMWRCRKSGPPLDGSTCGPNHHCLLGSCVARNQTNSDA